MLQRQLQQIVPLAKRTLLETRHYIHDLKPLLSSERDLVEIAEEQVNEFRMVAGADTRLSIEGEPVLLPVAASTGLYRILQEALSNVLKHARADEIIVKLTFTTESVRLSVQDNGVGFDINGPRSGNGLDNMHHRANELCGLFESD